jgi:hypothetical protein
MGHGVDPQKINDQLAACLQVIQQMRGSLPLDQVVAVDIHQIDEVLVVRDRSCEAVPCFAVRA